MKGSSRVHTSVSFWRDMKEVTRDFAFGLSRASYCKQREAKRTSSVPSSFEKLPSRAESISIRKFLPRIRSSACKQYKPTMLIQLIIQLKPEICAYELMYIYLLVVVRIKCELTWLGVYVFHSEDPATTFQSCKPHFLVSLYLPTKNWIVSCIYHIATRLNSLSFIKKIFYTRQPKISWGK